MQSKTLYVIGDVHGCYNEFKRAVEYILNDVKEPSVVCFLGDYIDRGPASFEVVDYLVNLKDDELVEWKMLMGNHEDMFMAYSQPDDGASSLFGDAWLYNGGLETQASYDAHNASYETHKAFYEGLLLYYRHSFGSRVVTCVHAAFDPELKHDEQTRKTMLWQRDFNKYKGTYADTDMLVHGHTPVHDVEIHGQQVNLDTACVFGNFLTIAKITYDEKEDMINMATVKVPRDEK